jgi:hypothetical protein
MNYANSNSIQPEPQMTPLQSARSALSCSIDNLENQLSSLRNRLNPALTPSAPTAATESKQQLTAMPPPASDMTQDIATQSRRIDALAMMVGDLLVRLEV